PEPCQPTDQKTDATEDQQVAQRDHPHEVTVGPERIQRDPRVDQPLDQHRPQLEPAGDQPEPGCASDITQDADVRGDRTPRGGSVVQRLRSERATPPCDDRHRPLLLLTNAPQQSAERIAPASKKGPHVGQAFSLTLQARQAESLTYVRAEP